MLEYIYESPPLSTSTSSFRIDGDGKLRRNDVVNLPLVFTEVSTGHEHSVALTSTGQVYGSGSNTYYQLLPRKLPVNIPYFIDLKLPVTAVKVVAFKNFTVVIDTEGRIWVRGRFTQQLKDWTSIYQSAPVSYIKVENETLYFVLINGKQAKYK